MTMMKVCMYVCVRARVCESNGECEVVLSRFWRMKGGCIFVVVMVASDGGDGDGGSW